MTGAFCAYEALLRGKDGAGAHEVLSKVHNANRYAFDQLCRVTAVDLARDGAMVSINFLPNPTYDPRMYPL